MMRILKNALLLGVGYVFATCISMLGANPLNQYEILFLCGFPAGWVFTGKHFGHLKVEGSLMVWFFFLVIKILVGSVIGWGVIAVEVIYGLFEIIAAPFSRRREKVEVVEVVEEVPAVSANTPVTSNTSNENEMTNPVYAGQYQPQLPYAGQYQPQLPYAGQYQPQLPYAGQYQPQTSYAGQYYPVMPGMPVTGQNYEYAAPAPAVKSDVDSPYDFFGIARPASAYEV